MHQSPTPTLKRTNSDPELQDDGDSNMSSSGCTAASFPRLLFITTIFLLIITSISCFATSWAVMTLLDWPVGSVVEKRSRTFSSSSSSSDQQPSLLFSLLHAALQREDHCSGETKDQIDRALGTFAVNQIQETVQRATAKKFHIESKIKKIKMEVEKEEKVEQEEKSQKKKKEQQEALKRKLHDKKENKKQLKVFIPSWQAPEFAKRASKFESHELQGYYAKHRDPSQKHHHTANDLESEDENGALVITSVQAIASAFRQCLSFMRVLSTPIQQNNDLIYARNTVDKLLYQLQNFEPLGKIMRVKNEQWNSVRGLLPASSLSKSSSCSAATSTSKTPKRLLLGLSSVSRRKNYLMQTVSSIISSLSRQELSEICLVILDADVPPNKNPDLQSIRVSFSQMIQDGTLVIIHREEDPQLPHPEMQQGVQKLTHRWGDDDERIKWRSKQVLDVSYLMDYVSSRSYALQFSAFKKPTTAADSGESNKNPEIPTDEELIANNDPNVFCYEQHLGGYFLMLEDDIIATKHFSTKILDWVKQAILKDTKWTVASFYNPWEVHDQEKLPPFKFFGVIGQLFRIHDLPTMVEFLRKNFDQSPLDWLFVDFLKKFDGQMVVHTPSMFQHEGVVSSLDGKTQDGRAVDFVA